MKTTTIAVLATLIGFGLVGCSQETKDQYSEAGKDISQGTQKVGKALETDAKKGADEASKAAAVAGSEIKDAAAKTKLAADNALETGKVKSAFGSASGLEAKDIDVNSDTVTKTITLKGTVPTEAQKAQAESVAKGIGGTEFKVVSNLKVAGK